MLYLAIDQHCKQLTVNLRNEEGDVLLKRQVSTEWKRVRAFFEQLQQQSQSEGGFIAIVEVCGFNSWLLKMLDEYGCAATILIQPKTRSKNKTDQRDAQALGDLLWVNRQRLSTGKTVQGVRRVRPASPRDAEDRQLTTLRHSLGQLRTRTINKIKHVLRKHNLQQECPTKGIDTIAAKKWLEQLALGAIDRLEMNQLLAQWRLVSEQIDEVDAMIKQRQSENETAQLIASMPGGGAFASLTLASRIGDIRRFPRATSLANYWGLTPGCRNSGEATSRLGSITKQGSVIARFILGQMVLHVLRRDPWMKAWYGKLKRRRGSKIARVAVMRRLATTLWYMIKDHRPYVAGGPTEVQKVCKTFAALEGEASAQARQKGSAPSRLRHRLVPTVG